MRTSLAALLALLATPVLAQAPCGPRDVILRALADGYREAPVAMGLLADGRLMEVVASGDGASWTVLLSEPGGRACVVAAGRHWQALAPAAPGRQS